MIRRPYPIPRLIASVAAAAVAGGVLGCTGGQAKTPPKASPKKPPAKTAADFRLDEEEIPLDIAIVRPSRFYVQFADAFILWHFDQQWKKIAPPFDFLMKGKKTKVDTDFGKIAGHTITVRRGQPKPWDVIGWGKHGALYHDDDVGCQVYQDKRGSARLILLLDRIYGCSSMILSSVSSHPGEIVKQDLSKVRTGTGIGLGDSRQKIERIHGKPSVVYPFRDSQVLWYLSKPEPVAGIEQLDQENHRGFAAAYLLKQNQVVEILVQFWSDETSGMKPVWVVNAGVVPYGEAVGLQERIRTARQEQKIPDVLLLLEHPAVITLGRGAHAEHLLADPDVLRGRGVEVHESARGGDVTYHGPGQIVGYPIFDLNDHGRDVHRYLRDVEEALIVTLVEFGLEGGRVPGLTGVWVGNEKVAAIGIGVRHWVTWHGFALNVSTALDAFQLIVPCGIRDRGVTSLERLLARRVDQDEALAAIVRGFSQVFHLEPVSVSPVELLGALI